MSSKIIRPVKNISGEISLPGDKSISHRAIMLGAISKGVTEAKNILDCDDCNFTIKAFRDMGIPIRQDKKGPAVIEGRGLNGLQAPAGPVNTGNSGTTMRLLAGILAGQDFASTLECDESLSKRPMNRIVEPLSLMGADIQASSGGYPPVKIKGGRLKAIEYRMPVSSAQVKSAVLLAGLYADGVTKVEEKHKSRDHTERMMAHFGADIKINGLSVALSGRKELSGKSIEIPGDISSASFFIAGAVLLQNSKLKISGVSINPTRAGVLKVLERMGARLNILNKKDLFEPVGDIEVMSGRTRGIVIEEGEIPAVIDELPVIFVLAALSDGKTVIKGARELKVKETDRINSMKSNLEKMGARIFINKGDIVIEGVDSLTGTELKSYGDHRTCMAMTIAALSAKGDSQMDDVDCVNKSFPGFFKTLGGIAC